MSGVGQTGAAASAGAAPRLSEVVPGDEDRGGDGALAPEDETAQDADEQTEGGTGSDDGGPGSRNM